eukprot:3574379-Pleurochrysis_carterae.AAC.1
MAMLPYIAAVMGAATTLCQQSQLAYQTLILKMMWFSYSHLFFALLGLLMSLPVYAHALQGPRPEFLVHDMTASPLKTELTHCLEQGYNYEPHPFSIAHRGACLQFPEHTE